MFFQNNYLYETKVIQNKIHEIKDDKVILDFDLTEANIQPKQSNGHVSFRLVHP